MQSIDSVPEQGIANQFPRSQITNPAAPLDPKSSEPYTAPETRPEQGFQITVGAGKDRPQGRLAIIAQAISGSTFAQALRHCDHSAEEAWVSPLRWRGNYRKQENFESASGFMADIDWTRPLTAPEQAEESKKVAEAAKKGNRYRPKTEVHDFTPAEQSQKLIDFARQQWLPGNCFYSTPRGFRVAYVFPSPLTTRESYQAFCRAAGQQLTEALGALGLPRFHLATKSAGFEVDAAVNDLARFLYTPKSKVNGIQRNADVLVLREAPYVLEELPVPPVVEKTEKLRVQTKPTPQASRQASRLNTNFQAAVDAYNGDHQEQWSKDSGTCPACGHNGCFGTVPDTGGERWSCFSNSHDGCGIAGDNGCWHGDQLDLDAHAAGLKRHELLRREGYLADRPPAVRKSVTEGTVLQKESQSNGRAAEAGKTVEELVAGFEVFAKENPTAAHWSKYWPEQLHAAQLGRVGEQQALGKLCELGVGAKSALKQEWKAHQKEQHRLRSIEEARAEREKNGKTLIDLGRGEEESITRIENLLVKAKDPEFPLMRDLNGYVRPRVDRPEWGRARNGQPVPTIAMLSAYDEESLRWLIDRYIDLERGGKKVKLDDSAPRLLQHPLPNAPLVRGLITHPLVREDGRLIELPGLDAESELYLHLGGKLGTAPPFVRQPIPVPDDPIEAQDLAARYAIEMLGHYDDYKFESDSDPDEEKRNIDKVVALSARLTLLTRKDLDIAPCFLLVGPERGTGKTTLAAIDHVIATGHDIPAASLEDDSEKAKQTLFAALSGSPAAVLFDNLPASECYGSDVLAQALTKGFVETRRFHSQTNVRASTNTLLYFTGNAVTLNEDLQARTLEVRFAAERPTKWSHPDWLSYARSIREEVRVKLQFIQRAFIRHGLGKVEGVYTRFPAWAQRVRDPLLWAGLDDVGQRFQDLEDKNPNRIVDAGIVAELQQQFGKGKFTAGEVVTNIGAGDTWGTQAGFSELRSMLQERIPRALGKSGAQFLGQYFREHLRRWLRVEDGQSVRLHKSTEKGCARWTVEVKGDQGLESKGSLVATRPSHAPQPTCECSVNSGVSQHAESCPYSVFGTTMLDEQDKADAGDAQ
jgi:hypothetical protein